MDALDLPFANDVFDVVFCGETIEHLIDPDHLLDEMHRVLKPGGLLILTTPNIANWYDRLMLLAGYQPYWLPASDRHHKVGNLLRSVRCSERGPHHLRFFCLRSLRELLPLHHFDIDRFAGAPITLPEHSSGLIATMALFMDKLVSRVPSLASFLIIKAHKKELCDGNNS